LNFVQTFFKENTSEYIACLEDVGFTADQILDFLPEAALGILDATQSITMYQAITCMQENNPAFLLRSINVDAMSHKLKMDSNQVEVGLCVVAPVLFSDLLKQCEAFIHSKKENGSGETECLNPSVENLL